MGSLPAAPFARIRKVSLVELSPSTVTWLKLRSAMVLTSLPIRPGSTAASVVTYASMVAMFGWIIPDPLHIPPSRTVLPASSISSFAVLGTVSVVRIARAAAGPPSALSLRSEEHTSELQSLAYLVCRLLLEKKKKKLNIYYIQKTKKLLYNIK